MNASNIYVTSSVEAEIKVTEVLDECSESELKELFKEYFDDDEIIAMVSEEELLSYVRKYYSKDEVFPNEKE